ncbi:MAG: class I tRNA ligase family protein, partial [Ignavibacteria bacterium]|nr:class I tRNA ligase family protein [Ignavibacteria bacterium]
SSIDYQSDVRISDDLLKQVIDSYKKLRNTFRFLLANLDGFDENKKVKLNDLSKVDLYILDQLNQIIDLAQVVYKTYDYKNLVSTCSNFMTNQMSAYYLDFTKDVLYIDKKEGQRRLEVQTVLHTVVDSLNRILAPILSHTMEEVHDVLYPNTHSVHLKELPSHLDLPSVNDEDWDKLFVLRTDIFKALELSRADKIIGKSLEAKVIVEVTEDVDRLVKEYLPNFSQWLIVSQSEIKVSNETKVLVEKAQGMTCPRCWNVTQSHQEDGLCDRCADVLRD